LVEVGWQVLKYIILFGTIMVNVCAVFYMRPLLYVISVGYVLIFLFPRRVDIPFPLVSPKPLSVSYSLSLSPYLSLSLSLSLSLRPCNAGDKIPAVTV
jgi:hypothetical protein